MDRKKVLAIMDQHIATASDIRFSFDEYLYKIVDAFGDDEEEVLDFLATADDTHADWVEEFYEELLEKFPSEEMQEMLHCCVKGLPRQRMACVKQASAK